MRLSRGVWSFGIVSALLMPSIGVAQKFQEPSKEELQMTSDPKAPDAPAVYLYIEEKMDNSTYLTTEYARIKVLTEAGKEFATVHVPYIAGLDVNPVIEGRTIHADGTVIALQGKGADLLIQKNSEESVKEAVFNLPSVEVGSILEYRWTVPTSATRVPFWEVQRSIYVHKAHFYFHPFGWLNDNGMSEQRDATGIYLDDKRVGMLLYAQRLPSGGRVVRSQTGDYTLDIQDVPPLVRESSGFPSNALRYQVRFYGSPSPIPDKFWSDETARWAKELDSSAQATSAITEAVAQITSGAATDEQKARKLYDAVQALENTDFTRKKDKAERERLHLKRGRRKLEDVLSEKSGSGEELVFLYLAMVRAAGLKADALKVVDRREGLFDKNYLSFDQLDTFILLLHLDGKEVYIDPGEKLCPFGQLHWAHTLTGGVQESAATPVFTPGNPTRDAVTAHAAEFTLDAQGNASGTVKVVMNGPAALHWRQLNLTADESEVRQQFVVMMRNLLPQGLSSEVEGFKGLTTPDGFLEVTVKVSGPLATVTGKRLLVPGFIASGGQQQFATTSRETPIDLHYGEQVIDDLIYHLPAGYKVEGAPQPAQLPWAEHATLVVKVDAKPNTLDVRRIFARAFVVVETKDYPALRDYYQKVATNDHQQVVLAADH